jgi:hypothetical protein
MKRCPLSTRATPGIEAFDRLVQQVMTKDPYASARRVFWIVDNGSARCCPRTTSTRSRPSLDG